MYFNPNVLIVLKAKEVKANKNINSGDAKFVLFLEKMDQSF